MPTYRVTMVGSTEEAVTQETGWINLWDLAMDKRERERETPDVDADVLHHVSVEAGRVPLM